MADRWTLVRTAGVVAVVLLALPASFCSPKGAVRLPGTKPLQARSARLPDRLRNHFVGIKPRISGLTARPERRLRGPLRFEATLGAFTKGRDALGEGYVGYSLLGAFPSNAYYGITVHRTETGLRVTSAASGAQPYTEVSTEIAGADRVSVAIDHDGDTVRFYAAAAGSAPTEFASAPAEGTGPYICSLDANDLPKKTLTAVGWDDLRMTEDGVPPGSPTPLEVVERSAYAAADVLVDASHLADGATPDLPTARQRFDTAVGALEALVAAADQAGAPRKVLDSFKAALIQAKSGRTRIDQHRSGKATTTIVKAAYLAAAYAVQGAAAAN